jgi:hypothetical protein
MLLSHNLLVNALKKLDKGGMRSLIAISMM